MSAAKHTVTVDRHQITLTNLDKVLYPETGTTKRDVVRYYAQIAPLLIAHAADRPVTRKRWVDGVGTAAEPGNSFFNKNLDAHAPSWIKHHAIRHSDHTNDYPLINDSATLVWFAQLATLEFHVPQWRFGPRGRQLGPDRLVLDLDPGEGAGLAECVEVAKLVRPILREMGIDPVPVTSGSKGIHLYGGLDGTQSSGDVAAVAHELARVLAADHPDLVVSDMKKSLRGGKVLIDWSQNNANKTTVMPYSLRGRFRPYVAVPRRWSELNDPDLRQLELDEVLTRMKRRKDPLAGISGDKGGSVDAGELPAEGGEDRLTVYRSKRDGDRTPEPVPDRAPTPGDGRSFVIQEHHASRLHYDFRLERAGVLVSWALPKGVPTDPKHNRLAVQTEDHPVEYGRFEGTIPKGEYGAGSVEIWDAGTHEVHKWHDDEIVVTLRGREDGGLGGRRKYALIRTGGEKAKNQWLIHLMGEETTAGDRKRTAGIEPMLATLGSPHDFARRTDGSAESWAFEMKWDGIRAVVEVNDDRVWLTSRNGKDLTASYPELAEAVRRELRTSSAILDGEIVALDDRSRPDFGRLQRRMGLTRPRDVERAAADVPVHLMLFDVLQIGADSLRRHPYTERREALESLVRANPSDRKTRSIEVPPAFDGDFEAAMSTSGDLGLEGIVAKQRDSTYVEGRRTRTWIKVKHHRTQEVVVGGWRPGSGRRAHRLGSLLLGVPDDDGALRYVGRVGTGFSDAELDTVLARLRPLARKTSPFLEVPRADARDAHWVTPKLVGEVEYAEWTSTGRLRQASWRGWRDDKTPAEVQAR